MNVYIVIDMQNDFIDGVLANPAAAAIVKPMADFLSRIPDNAGNIVIATRDTHFNDYLNTYEGKHLPIPHCIQGTKGWEINATLKEIINSRINAKVLNKCFFNAGEEIWDNQFSTIDEPDRIILMGTCTDICVVSNAFALKALFPETDICIAADLCAGLTPEKHAAALDVMSSCQFVVVNSKDL